MKLLYKNSLSQHLVRHHSLRLAYNLPHNSERGQEHTTSDGNALYKNYVQRKNLSHRGTNPLQHYK